MFRKALLTTLLLVLMLAAWVIMAGCQPKPEEAPMEPPVPPPSTTTPVEAPGEFEWSKAPTLASIPDGPITGMINGEKFEAKTVRIEKTDDGPELEISNVAAETPTGMVMDDTGIELSFSIPEGTTGEFAKTFDDDVDMETAHAWYWYEQEGDKGPMSVNPTWGCALQISDWTLKPDEEDKNILGKVKGKVAICFDELSDEQKGWVAGTFDCIYYEW